MFSDPLVLPTPANPYCLVVMAIHLDPLQSNLLLSSHDSASTVCRPNDSCLATLDAITLPGTEISLRQSKKPSTFPEVWSEVAHYPTSVAHTNLSILTTPSWITSTKSADKGKPATRSKSLRASRSRPSNNDEPHPDDKPARKKALKSTTEEHEYFTELLGRNRRKCYKTGIHARLGRTKSKDGRRAELCGEYGARLHPSLPISGSPRLSSYDDQEKRPGKRLLDKDSSDEEFSQAKRRLFFSPTIYILRSTA
ncbi:hypothetical protein FALBO_1477 [Fusarium albosuccineum]|uniref:Uncharacterized protein n=1 Tax=Fusarium albosuccineum TaxID=1237068 RepID=A0A8H4LMU0_9HYPO|nr:hypothetical protein FALBO_1477 [Fusarium albosuccineum]